MKIRTKLNFLEDNVEERILRCPCKKDIAIDRSSHIGTGSYGSIEGKHYHNIYCYADGPNNDVEKTFHHGYISFWKNFESFEEANAFTVRLWKKIKVLTGFEPPVYVSGKDKNEDAKWCMGEISKRPAGINPMDLPTDFESYN